MIPTETRDILAALLEKTRAGEAKWQRPRFAGGRDVCLDLGSYVLTVFETRHGAIAVQLKNDGGAELLSFSIDRSDPDYGFLAELLEQAQDTAMNLGGALNDVRRLVLQAGPVG